MQQSGCGAASRRLPIREVHGIGDACCGTGREEERSTGWSEFTSFLVRAVTLARATWTTIRRKAPSALGFFDVYPSVLAGELVSNLRTPRTGLRFWPGKARPPVSRDMHHEFRLSEIRECWSRCREAQIV